MVAEEIVLAAAGTVRAAHAANKEDGHSHRYHNGEQASIRREPMNQVMHIQGHHIVTSEISLSCNQEASFSERLTSDATSVASAEHDRHALFCACLEGKKRRK
jgi:hypothetical protein